MDRIQALYNEFRKYPHSLHCHQTYEHVLNEYETRLGEKSARLCCPNTTPNHAAVNLWQYTDSGSSNDTADPQSYMD